MAVLASAYCESRVLPFSGGCILFVGVVSFGSSVYFDQSDVVDFCFMSTIHGAKQTLVGWFVC